MKHLSHLIYLSLAAIFLGACAPAEEAETQAPYNLLFILTDEQRYDTSLPYGNAAIQTPALNQLGEEALVFQRAYVTQPVCSPARSSILTGHFPHYTTVRGNNVPLPDSVPVFPAFFPDEAFQTAYMGKWHLGPELDSRAGFDRRVSTEDGYTASDTSRFSDYHHWLVEKGYEPDVKPWNIFSREFCNRLPYAHTKSKFMEEQALAFLAQNQDRPFMLYLGFLEPHTPNFGPFDSLHDAQNIELDETYGTFVPEDDPLRHQLTRHRSRGDLSPDHLKKEMAKYWGLVHQVDRSVGAIIEQLKKLGLYERTIIVYTSEHGKMMGKYGIGGKSMMYEPSARVPFFLRIPGIEARQIDFPVSHIDLVPTLLEAMGQAVPAKMPGKSLLPYLDQDQAGNVFLEWHPSPTWNQRAYPCPEGYADEDCRQAHFQHIRTIVTPDGWKLCKSAGDADLSQLFHLREDPVEKNNLYYQAAYRSKRDSLLSLLAAWQTASRDTVSL
jgi:arylsulfatase A-like enzyme